LHFNCWTNSRGGINREAAKNTAAARKTEIVINNRQLQAAAFYLPSRGELRAVWKITNGELRMKADYSAIALL
jgi:hypothetical protein